MRLIVISVMAILLVSMVGGSVSMILVTMMIVLVPNNISCGIRFSCTMLLSS